MAIPPGVLAHWLPLARHTPLGVICDLDGTLLPFVATPSESRLPPSASKTWDSPSHWVEYAAWVRDPERRGQHEGKGAAGHLCR
jgi:hypothetical protein